MFKQCAGGVLICVLGAALVVPNALLGASKKAPAPPLEDKQTDARKVDPYDNGEYAISSIESMLEGIDIKTPTVEEFNTLYKRHKTEIHYIVDQHMDLVWETIDVILSALPALQSMDKTGGRLYLDKGVYGRANRLFERFAALAGSRLSKDLKEAKRRIDGKTEEWNSNQIMIDLSD